VLSPAACHDLCISTFLCQKWTFYGDVLSCSTFENCGDLLIITDDAVSGDASCPLMAPSKVIEITIKSHHNLLEWNKLYSRFSI